MVGKGVGHSQLQVIWGQLRHDPGLATKSCVGVGSPEMSHVLSLLLQGPSSPKRLLIALPLKSYAGQASQY